MEKTNCACGAEVYRVAHARTGSFMRFDTEPSTEGNWQFAHRNGQTRAVHVRDRDKQPGARLYVAHAATCTLERR